MQANTKKPSANNRRVAPKKRRENATAKVNTNGSAYANEECLSPKLCKGKHKKLEPNETFLKCAENLFKDQEIKIVNTLDECRAVISELRR